MISIKPITTSLSRMTSYFCEARVVCFAESLSRIVCSSSAIFSFVISKIFFEESDFRSASLLSHSSQNNTILAYITLSFCDL